MVGCQVMFSPFENRHNTAHIYLFKIMMEQ